MSLITCKVFRITGKSYFDIIFMGEMTWKKLFKALILFEVYLHILDGSRWYSLCGIPEKEKQMS